MPRLPASPYSLSEFLHEFFHNNPLLSFQTAYKFLLSIKKKAEQWIHPNPFVLLFYIIALLFPVCNPFFTLPR